MVGHRRRRAAPQARIRTSSSGGMRQRVMIAMALALEPQAADRRRADHRARRDDPGAGHRAHPRARHAERHGGAAHHPRPRRGRRHDPADLRDVRGVRGRDRDHARAVRTPRHPYTVGLLNSISRIDEEDPSELRPIEGAPPEQTRPPVGCPFAPRCAWRLPRVLDRHAAARARTATPPAAGARCHHRRDRRRRTASRCHNPPTDEEAARGPTARARVPAGAAAGRSRPTCTAARTPTAQALAHDA